MHNIEEVVTNLLRPILRGEMKEFQWSENLEKYIFFKRFICNNSFYAKPCTSNPDVDKDKQTYCVNIHLLLQNLKEMWTHRIMRDYAGYSNCFSKEDKFRMHERGF